MPTATPLEALDGARAGGLPDMAFAKLDWSDIEMDGDGPCGS